MIFLPIKTQQTPGVSWKAFELQGDATDPDLSYPLHVGLNSGSFSGAEPTPVADALPDGCDIWLRHEKAKR